MHEPKQMIKEHPMPAQGASAPPSEKGRSFLVIGLTVGMLLLLAAGWMIRHLLFSSRSDDGDAHGHWRRAQELIAAREFPQATDELSQCLEAWPYNAKANFLMARTWRRAG